MLTKETTWTERTIKGKQIFYYDYMQCMWNFMTI